MEQLTVKNMHPLFTLCLALLVRILVIVACAFLIGLPINSCSSVVLFLCIIVIAVSGTPHFPSRRLRRFLLPVLVVGALAKWLPQIEIQEGHQVFLSDTPDRYQVLRQALPPSVYLYAKDTFDRVFSPGKRCAKETFGCWRFGYADINRPFAFSADGAFQHPKYSRIVHSIAFDDLRSFRGGFLNSLSGDDGYYTDWYDWKATPSGDPVRATMPFFVFYELPASVSGQRLCWSGDVFVGYSGGTLEHRSTNHRVCEELSPSSNIRTIYGLSIDPTHRLSIDLQPRLTLHIVNQTVHDALTQLSAAALALLALRPQWRLVAPMAASAVVFFLLEGGYSLYNQYAEPFFSGGGDPLTYWGFGRIILHHAAVGNWLGALRGPAAVYYYMPGYSYFRAAEMALFGESGMLSLLVLVLYPYSLYVVARYLMPMPAAILTVAWYFLRTGDVSVGQLVGFGESCANPIALWALEAV